MLIVIAVHSQIYQTLSLREKKVFFSGFQKQSSDSYCADYCLYIFHLNKK